MKMGQAVLPEETLRAEELWESELGQAPTQEELLIAAEIAEVEGAGLGVVGAVASVGLKAAMPSIEKGLASIIKGKGAKEARASRTGAQNQLCNIMAIAEGLRDGTDELMTLLAQGQRIDSFQVAEADIAHQQTMTAWSTTAGVYASLAGTELGQLPATEVVERMFLEGLRRLGQFRPEAERLRLRRAPVSPYWQETPLRTGAQRLRANARLPFGQVPPTEEVERMFLLGYGVDLGRSAAEKRAARLGWLTTFQNIFMKAMKKANDNLNALAKATGVTRSTPDEAMRAVDNPITRPPAVPEPPAIIVSAPPPGAPTTPPPAPKVVQPAPPSAGPGWFPKRAIPVWVWPAGAGVVTVLGLGAYMLLRRPA
jgi:hypothetical protein